MVIENDTERQVLDVVQDRVPELGKLIMIERGSTQKEQALCMMAEFENGSAYCVMTDIPKVQVTVRKPMELNYIDIEMKL